MIAILVLAGVFGCFCFLALFAICSFILNARLDRPRPHQFGAVLDMTAESARRHAAEREAARRAALR